MQHASLNRFHTGLLALLLLCVTLPALAQNSPAPQTDSTSSASPAVDAQSLDDLSEQLDQIRQKVTGSANDDLLSSLRQAALQVQKQADNLTARQAVDIEHLNDQLNILGPAQPDEAPSLTSQRKTLTAQKNALVDDERQTNTLSQSARDLATQIFNLRRSLFDSQISTRTASPLSSAFWSTLIRPTDDDLGRLNRLLVDVRQVLSSTLAPENRLQFISIVVAALFVWVVIRRLLERLLIWSMIRWLPEGRLRRSALALAVGLSTILTITVATSLLRWGIVRNAVLSNDVVNLLDQVQTLITFCAFIVGLGRALLMRAHASWRLPQIPDQIATALGRFPPALALALMIIGTQERINS
ncbi:Small-conductance mechanosensitive channel protein, partial [Pseudomonas savastanoi]